MQAISDIANIYQGLARAGRGAGARRGDWMLRIVESSDLRYGGLLDLDGLQEIGVVQGARTERHLLRPFDVLVTARSGSVQVALVPPDVSRTVAGITLLVIRAKVPGTGMGHWLWYFFSSAHGRAELEKRMNVNASLKSLSAKSLGEIDVPVPSARELDAVERIVEASEAAYTSAVEAARLRRDTLRESMIHEIAQRASTTT